MARHTVKDIKLLLDLDVVNTLHGSDLPMFLMQSGYTFEVVNQDIKNSISVIRLLETPTTDESGETIYTKKEPFCIIVWDSSTVMPLIKHKTLMKVIKDMSISIHGVKIILALCGIKTYFSTMKDHFNPKKPRSSNDEIPVNRRELEWCLTELQVLMGVDHRILNNSAEFRNFIKQYVRSIAEIPYKAERYEKHLLTDGCVIGDRMECVAVSDGNGFSRLFKQQLMQFTRTTLEIAEAIINVYPTWKSLIEAYGGCSVSEGMMLLTNIPIRRAIGPLSKSRNIGPEISKKIYRFCTSNDGLLDIDE